MKKYAFTLIVLGLLLKGEFASAQFIKNNIIAHRGAWEQSGHPENSLASLNEAVKIGCTGSEFDVWMTLDGIPVVHHDPTMNGVSIEKTNFAELAKMKLSNGERMPTLEEYILEGKKQKRTKLILEIKTSGISKERTLELTEKCVKMVKDLKAKKWVDYISFDFDACKRVVVLDKNAKVSYVNWKIDKTPVEVKEAGLYGVDYHFKAFKQNPEIIQKCKDLGLTLNVWTVNDHENMKWFMEQGFDFITTDQPELLKSLLN